MKKTLLIFLLAGLLVFAGSCKRSSIDDPSIIVPPGTPDDITLITISGRTTEIDSTNNKVPLYNVLITVQLTTSSGSVYSGQDYTGINGNFTFRVPFGVAEVTITPTKTGYKTWTPATMTWKNIVTDCTGVEFVGAK
jgi:hypothetical protein